MNWIDYRELLGIGFEDETKLQMCKNRMKNIVSSLSKYYRDDDLYIYMNTVGEDYLLYNGLDYTPLNIALESICRTKTLRGFISKYVALINSANNTCVIDDGEKFLCQLFESAIVGTLEAYRIQYEIIRDDDGVFIFPKGVPQFDKDLVSDSLLWLSQYPETEKAWGKALRAYSIGEQPSEVADLFRKTLERFFQNFFGSDKTLENLKPKYGRYLKEHGIPGEITANLESVVQQYITFINNNAKHHDRTSSFVLEYIMYQTGNIMRLLIKISDEEKEE